MGTSVVQVREPVITVECLRSRIISLQAVLLSTHIALQIFTGLKDPYKITEEKISSMVEAEALGYKKDSIDIYSNGWGPSDNGSQVSGPSQLTKRAMKNGVDMV